MALVGGQLSYTDSQNCSAPIQTVNSVWLSSWPALSPWLPGRDAPFSPRRSMQSDDALLASDDLLIPPVGNYWDVAFDKSTSLTGGIRFIAHRWQPDTGTAIVTQAEVYADVWSCTLPTPEYDPTLLPLDCDWAHSYPIASLSRPPPYTPTASLPLPIAYSAHSEYRASRYHSLLRFGGVTSAAALQLWLSAVPTGAADVLQPVDWTRAPANVTLMQQPLFLNDATEQSPADFQALRFYMPLVFRLDEAELNSPDSAFTLGSDAVVSHMQPLDSNKLQPLTSTLHLQPQQMVQTPQEASWAVPQAADARNTSRPSFAFQMRRRGHSQQRAASTYETIIAGGESGSLFSNDWISFASQGCFWPRDPSYRQLLGPLSSARIVRSRGFVLRQDTGWLEQEQHPVFLHTNTVQVRCAAGHHFEPPLYTDEVTLTCTSTGLWMDSTLGSVRRCEPRRFALRLALCRRRLLALCGPGSAAAEHPAARGAFVRPAGGSAQQRGSDSDHPAHGQLRHRHAPAAVRTRPLADHSSRRHRGGLGMPQPEPAEQHAALHCGRAALQGVRRGRQLHAAVRAGHGGLRPLPRHRHCRPP